LPSNEAIEKFLESGEPASPSIVSGGASESTIAAFLGPAPEVELTGLPGINIQDRPGFGSFKQRFESRFNGSLLEDELLPKTLRAELANAPTVKDRIEMLQARFGDVKKFEGRLFVPQQDPVSGNPQYVEARLGVVGGLIGAAPEAIGTLMGTAGGAPMAATRLGKLLNLSVRGAAGASAAGVAEDVLFRELHDIEINVPEIARRRAAEGIMDVFLNIAGGGAEELTTSLLGLKGLRQRTERLFEGEEFSGLLERGRLAADKLGIPQTAGEITGSPTLARVESLISNIPFARERFRRMRIQQKKVLLRRLEDKIGPFSELMSDEELGRLVVGSLRDPSLITKEALLREQEQLSRVAFTELKQTLDAIEPRFRGLYARSAGNRFKAQARKQKLSQFDEINETQYGEFEQAFESLMEQLRDDGGELADRIVDIAPLQQFVKEIAEVRAPKKIIEIPETRVPGKITDERGDPFLTEIREASSRLAPSPLRDTPLRSMMDYIEDLASTQTLSEARELRRDIGDAIAKSSGHPHTYINPADLMKLSKLLGKQIESAVDNVPDPQVAELLRKANAFYSENIGKYERRGIAELLSRDRHGNDVTDDGAIVANLFRNAQGEGRGNSDYYFGLKEFFGEKSEATAMLKRLFLDDIVRRSSAGGDVLDGVALAKILKEGSFNREILDDMLPLRSRAQLSQMLSQFQKGGDLGNISTAEFVRLAQAKNPTAQQLRKALQAQREVDRETHNRFFKMADKLSSADIDTMPVSNLAPMLGRADPGEIRGLLDRLGQEGRTDLIDQLRRKFLYRVFLEADTFRTASDAGKDFAGAASIWRVVRDEKSKARLHALLTPEMEANFYDFLGVMAVQAQRDRIAATTGALLQGSMIHRIFTKLQGIKDLVVYDALAWTLTNRHIAKFVTSPRDPIVADTLLRMSMLTGPMTQEIFDTDDQHVLSIVRSRVQEGLNEIGLADLVNAMDEQAEKEVADEQP